MKTGVGAEWSMTNFHFQDTFEGGDVASTDEVVVHEKIFHCEGGGGREDEAICPTWHGHCTVLYRQETK